MDELDKIKADLKDVSELLAYAEKQYEAAYQLEISVADMRRKFYAHSNFFREKIEALTQRLVTLVTTKP